MQGEGNDGRGPAQRLRDLADDRGRGASEIARELASLLPPLVAAGAGGDRPPGDVVVAAGRGLLRAHGSMAPILNLVNQAVLAVDDLAGHDAAEAVTRLEALARDRTVTARALAEQGAGLVAETGRVLAYSRSGSVLEALRLAHQAGASLDVTVSEASPGMEGRTVVRALAEGGVRVTLTTDAALPVLAEGADLLVVGADALCADGVVNKVGTGLMARAVGVHGVPTVVLSGTDKVWPRALGRRPRLDEHAPRSSFPDLPDAVDVVAPTFEVAAYDAFASVVTEDGPAPPASVLDGTDAARVSDRVVELWRDASGPGG